MKRTITIAGGGLAGLSLAIGLSRRGIPVEVHEAGCYPRHRVCGEFISGVETSTLDTLGITDDLDDATRPSKVRWFRKEAQLLAKELPTPALGISRYLLDQRLGRRLVAEGGKLIQRSRSSQAKGEGRVWAAGRLRCKSPWIGLKCHLPGFEMEAGLEMHMGDNGYLGLAPIEDGRVNACGLFRLDRSLSGKGSDLLVQYLMAGGCSALAERLRNAARDEESFLGVSGFQLGWQRSDEEVCAVGDAEGMIPPFTGNGMSMAFESANMALEPLEAWSLGASDWSGTVTTIRDRARKRFRRRVRSAMALHRVLLDVRGQAFIEGVSRAGLMPFRPLLSLVR